MKKVKITVLKTTLDEELVKEYGAEGLKACPMLKAGQVFYADYAICSCNDGLRPVIFKLEATEEESVIDYTPVR